MMFTLAKVPFDDEIITFDKWAELKPSGSTLVSRSSNVEILSETPFGQLPVLEVDGKKLSQSLAIMRFAAKRTGEFARLFFR